MKNLDRPPIQGKPLSLLGCTMPFSQIHVYGPVLKKFSLRPEILLESSDVLEPNEAKIEEAREFCRLRGGATCHAPFISLLADCPDGEMLRRSEEVLKRAAELASRIEVSSAVIHPNWDPRKNPSHDEWLADNAPMLEGVCRSFIDSGVRPLIENVRESTPEETLKLLSLLPEETGVCIDPGHACIMSSCSLDYWLDALKDVLTEIHLHNNNGSRDEHLALDEGSAWNPKETLGKLIEAKARFYPILEPKDQATAEKSLKALKTWGLI